LIAAGAACVRSERSEGFTLAELLVVVAITAVIAGVALPLLSSQDSKKLEVAAQETGNALRFAVNEARRTGGYILVDAKTTAGRLKVVNSDATGASLGAVNDPLTKRALDIDTAGSAFSGPVSMTARFMQGGTAYTQLLISPTTQLQVFDGPSANVGALQPGSGIVLALGAASVTVTINESTAFVAIP
jgi:prepilin-type N-terminal cleavage/methylation domain-containing protein